MTSFGRLSLLTTRDETSWQDALATLEHDFYREAPYHSFCQEQGHGVGHMAVYREGQSVLVWPYLLRPITGFAGDGLHDITSVYGYPGPLASDLSTPFISNGLKAIKQLWREQDAVTAFTRLHPLLGNDSVLASVTAVENSGTTVSIDLARPPAEVRRGYQKSLKYGINKARNRGVVVEADSSLKRLPRFIEIYEETMARNHAQRSYFFGHDYFQRLFAAFPGRAHLFIASLEADVVAGSIFVETDGIVQYHLSATDSRYLPLAPIKLLLDEVRQWAANRGRRHLHLGGGRGGERDSLFEFKAAFSKDRYPFFVWKDVLRPDVYEELCHIHRCLHQTPQRTSNYFPVYRTGAPSF